MADVISFGNFETMQGLIAEGNAAVSGMSAAEAAAAMGAEANSGLYVYNATTAAGAGNVINFPNAANAAEAAAEYLAEGGTTAASGAATAATGAAEQAVNMVIGQTGAGSAATGVYGLLSMGLPTAAAALAPVAGVALGSAMYSAAPDFWEGLSRTLLPFCYNDSESLPAVVDAQGNTYYSEAVMNAVKQYMQDQQVGQYNHSSDLTLDPWYQPLNSSWACYGNYLDHSAKQIIEGSGYSTVATNASGDYYYAVWASNSSTTFQNNIYDIGTGNLLNSQTLSTNLTYTYDGKTVYFGYYQTARTNMLSPTWVGTNRYVFTYGANLTLETARLLAWTLVYGTISGGYPTGTSAWNGRPYPDGVTPVNILTGYDQQGNPIYTPYYPVSTPIGDPGVSNDPAVNPNPTANPNPDPAIDPYISPVPDPSRYPAPVPVPIPAPIPNPVPNPQPVPDPDRDPSRDPDPDEVPDDPKTPSGGKDTGDSTPPVIPVVPITPASGASLLHVYNPTQSQIDAFGSWLWTTWSDASIWQTIQKLFNDPMDGVIGLHELYATPSLNGSGTIRCGYMDSGVASALVGTRYTTINCGTIVVEEYYQNYLDYSPYTQVYVYLPFIGIMPLSADDIIGNAVNIKYHVDSYTGCCIATITVARSGYSSTVYQFEGNCAVEIPITSGYQSALMSGLLAVAGTAVSGNPSVGLTAAHVGRAGLGKNAVQHSGSFGSSYGAMGAKIPYIIVRRPVQKKVNNYSLSYGYPAHKMVFVGNCQGYLRVREVRVMSTTATNVEKEMIVATLKEGVYVK